MSRIFRDGEERQKQPGTEKYIGEGEDEYDEY
jgi:hypothetical protein